MKEHILDLIIIETNIDHTKIWEDYFSNKYEIKTFNSLDNSLENKKIFNKNTIFIIQGNLQNSNCNIRLQNNIIFLIDDNFSIPNESPNKNIFLKKPVSLRKIEKIIYEFKKHKVDYKKEIIKIKKYIFIPINKKLYSNDKSKFIKLTEKEVQILIELDNPKINSSKKYLLEKVWKYNPNIKTSTVESHIHRLRKKLVGFSQGNLNIKYGRSGYIVT